MPPEPPVWPVSWGPATRVRNIHSCSRSPAWPNGASRLWTSPVPELEPSSETEKNWTRVSDMNSGCLRTGTGGSPARSSGAIGGVFLAIRPAQGRLLIETHEGVEGGGDDDPVEGDAPAGEEDGLAEDQGGDRDVHRVADEAVEAADHQGAGGRDRGRGAKPLPGEAGEGFKDDDEARGDQDEARPAEGAQGRRSAAAGRQPVISQGIRPATTPGARTRKTRLPSAALIRPAISLRRGDAGRTLAGCGRRVTRAP